VKCLDEICPSNELLLEDIISRQNYVCGKSLQGQPDPFLQGSAFLTSAGSAQRSR